MTSWLAWHFCDKRFWTAREVVIGGAVGVHVLQGAQSCSSLARVASGFKSFLSGITQVVKPNSKALLLLDPGRMRRVCRQISRRPLRNSVLVGTQGPARALYIYKYIYTYIYIHITVYIQLYTHIRWLRWT